MKLDLHVHSRYSHDGLRSVEEIIDAATKRGLDGIAICDHDVFLAYEEARAQAPPGFVVIPGVEYSTDCGHILTLFVSRLYELPRDEKNLCKLADLRLAANADGALLVAAHPFRKRSELPEQLLPFVDGVEVENSRDAAKAPGNSAKSRAASSGKFITGGSDAHILREIGACRTILPEDTPRTVMGVRKALQSHKSDAIIHGAALRNQAMSKVLRTRPRTFFKDMARLIIYTAKDILNGV